MFHTIAIALGFTANTCAFPQHSIQYTKATPKLKNKTETKEQKPKNTVSQRYGMNWCRKSLLSQANQAQDSSTLVSQTSLLGPHGLHQK